MRCRTCPSGVRLLWAAAVLCVVALTGTSRWVPDTETSGVAATQVAYVVPASWAGR